MPTTLDRLRCVKTIRVPIFSLPIGLGSTRSFVHAEMRRRGGEIGDDTVDSFLFSPLLSPRLRVRFGFFPRLSLRLAGVTQREILKRESRSSLLANRTLFLPSNTKHRIMELPLHARLDFGWFGSIWRMGNTEFSTKGVRSINADGEIARFSSLILNS